jgi:tyrosinase
MVKPLDDGLYVREDLWSLPRWDPTLQWYALAMGAMFNKPIVDPSSWRFQAAIHGYDDTLPDLVALKQPDEALPADQNIYWAQCQHHGWYFLPWHRGYLGYFERIVRKTIIGLGGPSNWTLPYWNYASGAPNAMLMRPEFLEPNLPDGTPTVADGTPNPLFNGIVRAGCDPVDTPFGSAGDFQITPNDVSMQCLTIPYFDDHTASLSFGGAVTGFNHGEDGIGVEGAVETTPHDNVHSDIGGWMDSYETAALDPIFWIHHCNIDRLWAVWSAGQGHTDPTDLAWLQPAGVNFPFRFRDENGASQVLNPSTVVDTATSAFTYKYQDISQPVAPPATVAAQPQVTQS